MRHGGGSIYKAVYSQINIIKKYTKAINKVYIDNINP
jgi:hypothetical protein